MKLFLKTITALLILQESLHAQVLFPPVQLDSVMITASREGFDVGDFIKLVREDTSFYRAFKNIRIHPWSCSSSLTAYKGNREEKGSLRRNAVQHIKGRRRWLEITGEEATGKIYDRKKRFNFYTAELFDQVFFPRDTVNVRDNAIKQGKAPGQSHTDKLRTLMFNPGAEVEGIPLIGDRMAIFDPDMTRYYEYRIGSETLPDSTPCYVFSCIAKKSDGFWARDKAVIRELVSYFDKSTMTVRHRKYKMSYRSVLFDFDVDMRVSVSKDIMVDTINYSGNWNVPLKKREVIDFNIFYKPYSF
jgi:hypothetical protein